VIAGESGNVVAPKLSDAAKHVGKDLRELAGQVRERRARKYEELSDQARSYYDEGRRAAQEWEKGIGDLRPRKPLQAVLIAAGVGLLLGLLWKH